MTRPLAITERQVTALCKGAAKAGHVPVVQFGKVLVRLIPETQAIPPQDERRVDEDEEIRL